MQETNMIECRKISKQYFPTQFVRVIGDTAALPGTMTPTACLETFNESIRKNKVWLEEGSRDAISMQTEYHYRLPHIISSRMKSEPTILESIIESIIESILESIFKYKTATPFR